MVSPDVHPLPSLPPSPTEQPVNSPSASSQITGYPPTSTDEEETRRVQETLRRWEAADKRRRRAARESDAPSGPSVFEFARRARFLWNFKSTPSRPLGNHSALQSQDSIDTFQMDLAPSPNPASANPFSDPVVAPQTPSIIHSSDHLEVQPANKVPSVPLMQTTHPYSNKPPPPVPLNIPPPRTPPPYVDSDHNPDAKEGDGPGPKWWHEWLCGCGERGETQAGRTNPFE